jgi:hypothetical protein
VTDLRALHGRFVEMANLHDAEALRRQLAD